MSAAAPSEIPCRDGAGEHALTQEKRLTYFLSLRIIIVTSRNTQKAVYPTMSGS